MKVATAPAFPMATTPQSAPVRKPLTESWSVGQETFASTADLVAHAQGKDGLKATYNYTTQPDAAPFTHAEKLRNAVGVGSTYAVGGALAGGVVGAGMAFAAGLGDVLNALGGGRMTGVSNAVLLAPVAIGAVIGACVGARDGYKSEGKAPQSHVPGVLQQQGDKLAFYPLGQVEQRVELNQYLNADSAPSVEVQAEPQSVAGNALKGAVAGAAIAPALFIPVVGLGVGAYVGTIAGEALDKRTAMGEGVGLALGVAATVGTIVAANIYGTQAIAYAAGGLGIAGAALGHAVFSRMGTAPGAHPDYGQQWWNRPLPE